MGCMLQPPRCVLAGPARSPTPRDLSRRRLYRRYTWLPELVQWLWQYRGVRQPLLTVTFSVPCGVALASVAGGLPKHARELGAAAGVALSQAALALADFFLQVRTPCRASFARGRSF
jgi:hypothetical protein